MNPPSFLRSLLLGTALAALSFVPLSAQTLTVSSASGGLQLYTADFTQNASGDYTLSNPSSYSGGSSIPASLASYIDWSGGGLFSQSAAGNVWVASNNLMLGDPFVTYSLAFQNTSSVSQTFTTTINVPFTSTTFNPSLDRASFLGSLVDGNPSLSGGVTASAVETGLLFPTDNSGASTITLLNVGTLSTTGTPTFNLATGGYPNFVPGASGTFDDIGVTVSVTLSPGAFIAVTGRIDAVPEPSAVALFAVGLAIVGVVVLLRSKA